MRAVWVTTIVCLTALAGCAEATEPTQDGEVPEVEVTATTGGIRGVVVDDAITPIAGVDIFLPNTGASTTSDASGGFAFSKLEPGTYFIQASKFGYDSVQSSVIVEAGIEKPPAVRIQMPKLDIGEPSEETLKFDGFYECAFSLFFITDSCDFAVRTLHDEGAPVPRHVQNNINTAFYELQPTAKTMIQEAFWDTSSFPKFRASIADTPIDNLCDCSNAFLVVVSDTGTTYGRLDAKEGAFPSFDRDYAVRGFIPFAEDTTEVNYALNVKFEIFTSVFYNYEPLDGWNLAERDDYPRPG